jgi:amidophosphoribosyltransferase
MGKLSDGSIVFASESCALDTLGADYLRDVLPGEIITVDEMGIHEDRSHCAKAKKSLCVFEYIYFSRPDSVVDGTCVSTARQRAGMFLAQKHPLHGDVVVGVPDSGLDAAIGYAQASGIPYAIGFTKNKYIARTFISPSPSLRESAIRLKLNPIRSVLEGKRVVLIDDSIVRGTTCRRTVELVRQAGAKEVHMLVSAPPFVAPCFYGTDIDSAENLIAHRHSVEEIARMIGADSLGYLSLEQVRSLAPCSGPFCTACFGGCYPTPMPKHQEKDRFAQKIHDA